MTKPFLAALLLLAAAQARAHEFIVKPEATSVPAGAPLAVTILSSHVFMRGEELEPAGDLTVSVVDGEKRTSVALSAQEEAASYRGTATAPGEGGFIVAGSRLPQIWSLTPEGLKRGTPAELPGARRPLKVEKFSKALVNMRPGDGAWGRVLGDRLEIVPLINPATVTVGEDLPVRILFDGKPLSTRVFATFDGFTDVPNSYAYFTETADDGTAKVRLWRAGLWMVRVEQRMDEKAADHDAYMARAVLVFPVKG